MSDGFKLVVPQFDLLWFPEGEHCDDAQDGDLVLIRHPTLWADAISKGERAMALEDPTLEPYTWCDHSAAIRKGDDDHDLSQMGPRGYERADLIDYAHLLYAVVQWKMVPPTGVKVALGYDIAMSGVDYGWAEYAIFAADELPLLHLVGSWGDSLICSGHATLFAMGLGLFPDRQPNAVVPAHMARWFDAAWTEPLAAA